MGEIKIIMILYFYGEDTFRSREHLRRSVDQFKKQRDPRGYNTNTFESKGLQKDRLFAEINTMPFLAEKRLVVIQNLLSSSDKELLAEFSERLTLKKFPESSVIVCWQGDPLSKVKEAKSLHELLQKEKFAQEFPLLVGPKLSAWIEKEITDAGGKIEKAAADQLATAAEKDVWRLHTTLNQLIAFKNKEVITSADVDLFSEEKIDDNVFNLVDAVVSGNHKLAFKLLYDQRAAGEEDGKLFGLFLWQFRILLEMSDLLERDGSLTSDEVAKQLKVHPFVARKNFALAKRYSLSKLQTVYERLLDLDFKTKTGRGDQSLLLDLFVAKM